MLPTPLVISRASHLLNPLWGCTSLLRTSLCFMRHSIHQTETSASERAQTLSRVTDHIAGRRALSEAGTRPSSETKGRFAPLAYAFGTRPHGPHGAVNCPG